MMLGIVPNTKCVLHDAEEEENLFHLCHHSTKLAISLGLINTVPDAPLHIDAKICEFAKIATLPKSSFHKIDGRAVMLKDANLSL